MSNLGAVGAAIATPTDLVKVRLQACAKPKGSDAQRYSGTLHAFRSIWRLEGVRGLYIGIWPTVCRATILTATQVRHPGPSGTD